MELGPDKEVRGSELEDYRRRLPEYIRLDPLFGHGLTSGSVLDPKLEIDSTQQKLIRHSVPTPTNPPSKLFEYVYLYQYIMSINLHWIISAI